MIYSKLHHFKGSQKVHKGSQESVNPLCESYNKYNILYINKLWATHDQSCEAYVNPLKYATRWYSERLAYFVNPYTIFLLSQNYKPIPSLDASLLKIEDWKMKRKAL